MWIFLLLGTLVVPPAFAELRICNSYTGECHAADSETSQDPTYEDVVQQMQARQQARVAQHAAEQARRLQALQAQPRHAEKQVQQRMSQRALDRYIDDVDAGLAPPPWQLQPAHAFDPPPLQPPQSFILRTPSGALYWGVGSTIWGPDGSYTIY